MVHVLPLTEDRVMRYTWQLLQATRYLHEHHLGHRDISLENILISFGDTIDGQIRLMDFGQAVETHNSDGLALRYFAPAGKSYYRPPECYIPGRSEVYVPALAGATLGQVVMRPLITPEGRLTGQIAEVLLTADVFPGRLSRGVIWGYTVKPVDVFACGVAFFILSFRAPPWKHAVPVDEGFKFLIRACVPDRETVFSRGMTPSDHDIARAMERMLRTVWNRATLSPSAMALLASMIQHDPSRRPTVQDCLADLWFAPMADVDVPTHQP